jgi:hypothetical protein
LVVWHIRRQSAVVVRFAEPQLGAIDGPAVGGAAAGIVVHLRDGGPPQLVSDYRTMGIDRGSIARPMAARSRAIGAELGAEDRAWSAGAS